MSVRKIKTSWWVDVRVDGVRYRKRSPVATKQGAQEYELLLMRQLMDPSPPPKPVAGARRFADFIDEWLEVYVKPNCKYSDQRTKAQTLRLHLLPAFGRLPLSEITSKRIEEFKRGQIAKHLNPKTINNHLGVLSKALHSAAEWGELDVLPLIKPLKVPPKEMKFLASEHCARLLSDQQEPVWTFAVSLALNTGMRLGELMGLRWEHVNLDRATITVVQSIVDGRITTPKNHKSRTIPMSATLRQEMSHWWRPEGWVVPRTSAEELRVSKRAADGLARMCRRVGLARIGWHALRHTFASHLVMRGVPLYHVQKLLGHSSLQMTERYAHLSTDVLHDAVAVLGGEFASRGQPAGNRAPYSQLPALDDAGSIVPTFAQQTQKHPSRG